MPRRMGASWSRGDPAPRSLIARMKRHSLGSPAPLERIPARESHSQRVNVIIDTPAGSRSKYRFDSELGVFRVSRVLPEGSVFPFDFGSIPHTRAEDGDALDVMVLDSGPTFPGCLLTVRLIGVIRAAQRENRKVIGNDRLIGVNDSTVNPARIHELRAVPREMLRAIEHFFVSYNAFQGRHFELKGRAGPAKAVRLLDQAIKAYEQQFDS